MAWRCCAETSGVLGLFVNPTIFTILMRYAIFWGESRIFFIILLRLEYFLQQRMTWLMHGPWEPGRVSSSLQHPRAGSSWPGCGWWSNLVRTCYNILGDQDGDISSHTEQQPGMLRFPGRQVPEFIFPVIFPPSSHQLGSHT